MRPEQIDETGVNVFAIAMKNKMRVMRERGRKAGTIPRTVRYMSL